MDSAKLKLYYMYFIPITLLQSITTFVLMGVLSVEDYGLFTLYLSLINVFFFLTFGLQNGYTMYHLSDRLDASDTKYLTFIIALLSIGVMVLSIPVLHLLNIDIYWKLAFLSGVSNVVFIFHKSIFRTHLKIHTLNIYTLMFRVIFLLDALLYLVNKDIVTMLLADVVMRVTLTIISTVVIGFQFKSSVGLNLQREFKILKKILRLGLPIMIGNWLISIYTILDKTFLASNKELLGLYSFAITTVLFGRVILLPLSEMYFVTLDENQSRASYLQKMNLLWLFGSAFVLVAAGGIYVLMVYFNIFNKYIDALPLLLLLLNILPISVSLDIYIYNISRRSDGKKFLMYAVVSALVTLLILYTYVNAFDINLLIYGCLVYFSYLVVYAIFISSKLAIRDVTVLIGKHLIFMIIYGWLIFKILAI